MTDPHPDTLIEVRAKALYRLLSDLSSNLSSKEKVARCEVSLMRWLHGKDDLA